MRFSHHANTADAVELEETAPQRGQRSPMQKIVHKYLPFITAQIQMSAWNRHFAVDFSGACPRRWKIEFQSISIHEARR